MKSEIYIFSTPVNIGENKLFSQNYGVIEQNYFLKMQHDSLSAKGLHKDW